jgi:hypothetical protein
LEGEGKLDKKPWKGRNGWMGWSTMLFAEKRLLCYKVTNKLVCEQFIDSLRNQFCLPEVDNTIVNRQRNRLIVALDFGVKGKVADETNARDACECAGFCAPPVNINMEKGYSHWVTDVFTKRGFIKNVIDKTINKKYLQEMYRESIVQEELKKCVVGIPMPRPILPKVTEKAMLTRAWTHEHLEQGERMEGEEGEDGEDSHEGHCRIGEDYDSTTTGIFVNRVSYMGHCKDDYMCFVSDYMNQAEPGRTLIETTPSDDPDTPTLSVFDLSGETERDDSSMFLINQALKKDKFQKESGDLVRFKAWGKSPESREYWTHKGIVYAELIKSPSTGMQKIVVVQSGLPKQHTALKQVQNWFRQHLELTGHNNMDPRKVLEIEDRDGNDMCMFM